MIGRAGPSAERLRRELPERYEQMVANLDQVLAEGNGEKAVRLYFDLVDQAHGKPAQDSFRSRGRRFKSGRPDCICRASYPGVVSRGDTATPVLPGVAARCLSSASVGGVR